MAQQEPTMATTCDHCGTPFNTSAVHPSRYCSIACEEGRAPLPMDDPASPAYAEYLQGDPRALVGKTVVVSALKRTCYSPDWHRKPRDFPARSIVSHDEDEEVIVYKTDKVLGKVMALSDDGKDYLVETEDPQTGEVDGIRWVDASTMLHQIRKERWWVDG